MMICNVQIAASVRKKHIYTLHQVLAGSNESPILTSRARLVSPRGEASWGAARCTSHEARRGKLEGGEARRARYGFHSPRTNSPRGHLCPEISRNQNVPNPEIFRKTKATQFYPFLN